jgi:hypothetical protein
MLKLNICGLVLRELGGKNVDRIERPITVVNKTPWGNKPEMPLKVAFNVMLEDELDVDFVRLAVAVFGHVEAQVSTA